MFIWFDGRDINREMVREGHAWAYRDYLQDRTILEDENHAKSAELGLWSLNNPIPPWEWRRGERGTVAAVPSTAFHNCSQIYPN